MSEPGTAAGEEHRGRGKREKGREKTKRRKVSQARGTDDESQERREEMPKKKRGVGSGRGGVQLEEGNTLLRHVTLDVRNTRRKTLLRREDVGEGGGEERKERGKKRKVMETE